jgi:hypothetical protein
MTIPSPLPPRSDGSPVPLGPLPPLTVAYASAPMPEVPADWTSVEIFALRAEALGPFIRLVVFLQVLISLLLNAAVFTALVAMRTYRTAGEWIVMGTVLGTITAVSTTIKIFRVVRKQKRVWQFYRLVVADQGLIQFQVDRPQSLIRKSEVRRITEGHDMFRIQLGVTAISVPKRVESPERVRERLAQWMPIQQGKGLLGLSATIAMTYGLAIAGVIGYLVGLGTGSRDVLIGCLIGTIGLAAVTMFRIMRDRSHARSVRVLSLLNLFGPAMLVARLLLFPPGR